MKKFISFILILSIIIITANIIDNMDLDSKRISSEDTKSKTAYTEDVESTTSYIVSNPSNTQSRQYLVGKDIEPGVYELKSMGDWGNISYKHEDKTYLYWNIIPSEENSTHEYTWKVTTGGVINVGAGSGGVVIVNLTKISE